jgi:Na+-translocating ferredoxin:NAD+ oxidoreductase subunit A
MEFVAKFLFIAINCILLNNYILARFLGLCPYLGVSTKLDSAFGMGAAVVFVMTLASSITYLIQYYILIPMGIGYLQTIAFILTIAALVQLVEMAVKKSAPSLYKALGIYLPLITTNCAVLGVSILNIDSKWTNGTPYNFLYSSVQGFMGGAGFTFVILLMAGIREKLAHVDMPEPMKGMPIALIVAGSMALAFFGFSGLKIMTP